MLFVFELLLAVIIVAVRHYLKNKKKYQIKLKRIVLKATAAILQPPFLFSKREVIMNHSVRIFDNKSGAPGYVWKEP